MAIIICPGIHNPQLTHHFLTSLNIPQDNYRVFPAEHYPAYSGLDIVQFLQREFPSTATPLIPGGNSPVPLLFVSFSAGVVGAIAAAWAWQLMGGTVKAFIALDGWGVPLYGDFPIYRVSHDQFTHWSSALLGAGQTSFYADPPVEHLELWRSPHTAMGYSVGEPQAKTTAADFITSLLVKYGEGVDG